MPERIRVADLDVALPLYTFVATEALPGTGLDPDQFWRGLSGILQDFCFRNRALLERRAELQAQIDAFHREQPGQPEPVSYRAFLEDIGYITPRPADFSITTSGVDTEITEQAGPQLVVPLLNARFATNAANARWGSLYDALYGSDAIADSGELARTAQYNDARGAEVVSRARAILDLAAPLAGASHSAVSAYRIDDRGLAVTLTDGSRERLVEPSRLVGFLGERSAPTSILLVHHGLHLEILIDRDDPVGGADAAGVRDVLLESALTSIMDLEDSVAAVDAEDKTLGYHNWLELNRGTLTEQVAKNGQTFTRRMHADREYRTVAGGTVTLSGRALMFIRQVGHLMTTDAILDANGDEVPEGILDAVMTALGSLPDMQGKSSLRNSRTGAMYVVKPKMHGPDEVAFTVDLLSRVERLLGLPPLSIKLGIMDEERRTTVNLAACIDVAKDRVVFINTGFLDRTGDEIHTSLVAGPFVRKGSLKSQRFIQAYEDANVDTGLAAGLQHRAQIGKGMWAMPTLMAAMLEQKIAHPRAGATTAWVPSPTAATLHAIHYHQVDVFAVQDAISSRDRLGIAPILEIPLAPDADWSDQEKRDEVDNNIQSILGYVVRWVDQGIGCSTVPDINDVGLMEDRATLRISSQLLANWLQHEIISEDDVLESLQRIAPVVDRQNADDPRYEQLFGPGGPGLAYLAARDLVLLGADQPNGYTEPILHAARRQKKASVTQP